jgi:hypothetical protein
MKIAVRFPKRFPVRLTYDEVHVEEKGCSPFLPTCLIHQTCSKQNKVPPPYLTEGSCSFVYKSKNLLSWAHL